MVAARKDCSKAYSSICLSRGAPEKESNTTLLICKASKIGILYIITPCYLTIKIHIVGLECVNLALFITESFDNFFGLLGEWRKNIEEYSRGLKVEEYHGPTRFTLEDTLHLQDIVITSYEVQRY